MIRDHSIVLIRRIIAYEMAFCGVVNRMSHSPAVGSFFVFISWLGDGRAWYALILTLPLVSGETGLVTSMSMVKVGVVNLVLYKIIKSLTGRARPCSVSSSITLRTEPL